MGRTACCAEATATLPLLWICAPDLAKNERSLGSRCSCCRSARSQPPKFMSCPSNRGSSVALCGLDRRAAMSAAWPTCAGLSSSEALVSIDTEVHQVEYNSRRTRGAGLYQRQRQKWVPAVRLTSDEVAKSGRTGIT